MDLFMPAERVLYDRAYYLSDEAERDYAFEVAEEHGVDVGEVLYSDELMKEVRDALDRDIDLYLDDEIANFDSMLRELKRGEDPEHPAEISVVAMGSVGAGTVPPAASSRPTRCATSSTGRAARTPSWIAGSTDSSTRTARSASRRPTMTAPPTWTCGSSPGYRSMARGSDSEASSMLPARWT